MNNYALITGAAKGIGRAIASELAGRGYHLLLTDVDGDGLERTEYLVKASFPVNVHRFEIDLSDEDAARNLYHLTHPYHDQLSIVVNNAGYGLNGSFVDVSLQKHIDLVNVNVRALMSISYLFAPVLNRQPKGWLLNVGSTTAYQTVPFLNTYAASKAFVLSFTRGLRQELKRTNISVSCLSPGSTDTDFVNRAGMSSKTKKLAERYNMTPQSVARIAIDGLFGGKAEIVPGLSNKLHAQLAKFFPKSFIENIAANIYGSRSRPSNNPLLQHSFEEDLLTN